MKKILMGGLAAIIGVAGISTFFCSFWSVLLGSVPALLILGGALAFYLGFTEVQTAKKDKSADPDLDQDADQVSSRASGTPEQPAQAPQEPAAVDAPASEAPEAPLFKGNAETLVFHSIECNFASGKKCTAEFTCREEAIEQGYKPCKVCNP